MSITQQVPVRRVPGAHVASSHVGHPRPTAADDAGAAPDEVIIRVTDDLLADGLAELRWLLHDHLLAGARVLRIDLSGVDQLASPAVAAFLWAHRLCRGRGGGVVLTGANRRTHDLLRRTGLWRVLRVESGPARRVR